MNSVQITQILEAILVIKSEDFVEDCLSCNSLAIILSNATKLYVPKSFVENCVHYDSRHQLNLSQHGSFLHFLKLCGWSIDINCKKKDFSLPGRRTGLRLYPPSRTEKISFFQSNDEKNHAIKQVLLCEFHFDEEIVESIVLDANCICDNITPQQHNTHNNTSKRLRRNSYALTEWCEGRF